MALPDQSPQHHAVAVTLRQLAQRQPGQLSPGDDGSEGSQWEIQ